MPTSANPLKIQPGTRVYDRGDACNPTRRGTVKRVSSALQNFVIAWDDQAEEEQFNLSMFVPGIGRARFVVMSFVELTPDLEEVLGVLAKRFAMTPEKAARMAIYNTEEATR